MKKDKNEQIELDLLMGILEQQKKKEITINNIIGNKRDNLKNEEKGEEEIINIIHWQIIQRKKKWKLFNYKNLWRICQI